MTSLQILQESDFDAVWTIFKSVFEHKYITEFHVAWTTRNSSLSFGIFDEQRILVGFLLTKQIQNNHQQIEFIGVSPTIQKGGIGTHLLRKVLDDATHNHYMVTLIPVNDERIIGWYKKHGFQNYGQPRISSFTGDLEQVMIYDIQSSGRQTNS
ncbi:MAG: GNAT family N-acetyltransferase [Flavobacteriia bacterium]|nr:GNAT family N-acetyltransferase [Flavobacteriia bacterium]